MTIISTASRLDRLDELKGLLKSGDHHTAANLADQLGVSKRTLMRDIEVLRERGYPIEADQGRGGGLRLNRHWGIGKLQLSYKEVIDLLLSLAIMEKIGSPVFLGNLKAIRHKLSLSFPEEQRNQVQSVRKRILLGELASTAVISTYPDAKCPAASIICETFFERKLLEIDYLDAGGTATRRTVEPQYLLLNWPVWYLLAWDHLRQDIRCFRMDRIKTGRRGTSSFKVKNVKAFIEGFEAQAAPL